ncbi:MAG: hypothetical protein WDN03_09325 [Rhizomicrobium sp.]
MTTRFGGKKGADQILGAGGVDRALGPDAGIGLRKQRGRQQRPIHAAEHDRRDEARHVLDNSTADRDEQMVCA